MGGRAGQGDGHLAVPVPRRSNDLGLAVRLAHRHAPHVGPATAQDEHKVVAYPAGSISGILTNTSGERITGTEVCLSDLTLDGPVATAIARETAQTGAFRFEGLPAGAYAIWSRPIADHIMRMRMGDSGIALNGRADPAQSLKKLEKHGLDFHQVTLRRGEQVYGVGGHSMIRKPPPELLKSADA